MQLSTTPASSPTVPMVMSTPHLPGMNNTAPVPIPTIRHVQRQNMRRPTPEITYLGRTHSATRVPLTPPPPPLIPPPTTHQVYQNQPVAIRPAMIPQNYKPSTSTPLRSSTATLPEPTSQRTTPFSAWSKPRSRMETARQHYENGAHGRVFRQSGESPWSHEQSAKIQPRTTKPPYQPSQNHRH
ncbi:hypothetical protein KEM48_011980 [Puccinia striiformis f. sp. tritici PST-130]|nr:hypothetical protein KEM48_011980 [Puccinia striiformis f. sp. tritici PST-130]